MLDDPVSMVSRMSVGLGSQIGRRHSGREMRDLPPIRKHINPSCILSCELVKSRVDAESANNFTNKPRTRGC